jgi:hypothetical protein
VENLSHNVSLKAHYSVPYTAKSLRTQFIFTVCEGENRRKEGKDFMPWNKMKKKEEKKPTHVHTLTHCSRGTIAIHNPILNA